MAMPSDEQRVTDEQLTEWEQAESGATEGPWSAVDEHGLLEGAEPAWCVSRMRPGYEVMSETDGYLYDIAYVENTNEQADAEFIAAAREAVPVLIAEVRASRAREAEQAIELAGLREAAHIGIELDNHHNAARCPYCHAPLTKAESERDALRQRIDKALAWLPAPGVDAAADAIRAVLAGTGGAGA